MKMMLTIPLETYNGLIGRCSLESREYRLLTSGVLSKPPTGDERSTVVRIFCDDPDAHQLFLLAARSYPNAITHMTNVPHTKDGAPTAFDFVVLET